MKYRKYGFILLGSLLGIILWVADAAIDHFFFYQTDFFDLLCLRVPSHELYTRVLLLLAFLGFGILSNHYFHTIKKTKRALFQEKERLRIVLDELERSEARYREMFDRMNNAVAVYRVEEGGKDFVLVDFNRAAEKAERIGRENVIGKSVLQVFPGVKKFGLFPVFQQVYATGKPETHPVSIYEDERIKGWRENYVYKLPSGEVVALYEDATERMQLYESLRLRERELLIRNQIDEAFLTLPEEKTYEAMLSVVLDTFGCKSGFLGYTTPLGYLVCPCIKMGAESGKKIVFQDEWKGILAWTIRERQATFVNDEIDLSPVMNGLFERAMAVPFLEHDHVVGVVVIANRGNDFKPGDMNFLQHVADNISPILQARIQKSVQEEERKKAEMEKKKLEEQVFQAQKMESIGRLSGGIAHDFNNILMGIIGYAEMLSHCFTKDSEERKAVEVILKSVERAAHLTRQLLSFSRKGKYNPMPLDMNQAIEETVKVTEKIFEKNIVVRYELDPGLRRVEADKNQIEQVLTNLIINAKDAIVGHGEITFRTENAHIQEKETIFYPGLSPGDYVKVMLSDTGNGMTEEVQFQIFEPFFTTKEEGKGTGLGLATVYNIIKNHQGHIFCASELGKGSCFTFYLPASQNKFMQSKREEEKETPGGDKTILLIDDEETLLKIMKRQLEGIGYRVLTATDGKEAIDIYARQAKEIDLVLLDLVMPNMGGKEIYRAMKEIQPQVKVVIISGLSKDMKAKELMEEGAIDFVQKPFKLNEIANAIHAVFNQRSN